MTAALVRLDGVVRRFGSVTALDGASLELRAGEVHGVLGANGAGKSTLFNVLGGLLAPDDGTIEIEGAAVTLSSPRDAWARGIGLVHQHFTLVPTLTVLENLALGSRGAEGSLPVVREAALETMERTGLRVPLAPRVEALGVGDRQRIEILKALLRDPRVLVLDEPTAVLTPDEVRGLFDLLRDLAAEGRAVALVAHKIDEILSVADRVTVLRDGRTVASGPAGERPVSELVRAMVGDDEVDPIALGLGEEAAGDEPIDPTSAQGGGGAAEGEEGSGHGQRRRAEGREGTQEGQDRREGDGVAVARLRGVTVRDGRGERLRDADLEVRPGEVLGIAGIEGNGQRELALVLAGRRVPDEGAVELPEAVGFISQDRSHEGLIGDFDLTENVALAFQRKKEYRRGALLRWDRLEAAAEEVRRRYDVAAPSVATRASALSGGNQQRVVVGRELGMASELLVAENPSRGLDVAAAALVHQELRRIASEGVAVVLVSTDLDEILALSDRIFAIAGGRLIPIEEGERSREGVGARMLSHGRPDG